jgi:hypothetical protein
MPPVIVGSFAWRSQAIRFRSPSVTASPANVELEAPLECRPDSNGIKCRSSVASATTPEFRTRRTGKSTSSTSAPIAARRSSTPSHLSRISSSSRSVRSPTRRSRRRLSRATTLAVTTGWDCPTRSSVMPLSCGTRYDLSTTPAGTGRRWTRAAGGHGVPTLSILQR